jgi:hypothetical protein
MTALVICAIEPVLVPSARATNVARRNNGSGNNSQSTR